MRYEKWRAGNGEWHCPFEPEWLERMAKVAKHCESVTEAQVEATLNHVTMGYVLPQGDFLSEPQDARGLPLSYCREEERRYRNHPTCCTAIYDYDSVPDMVISNGHDDWPLRMREPVLTA